MPTKYGHERRNRQDKGWKEPGGCVGGNTGLPSLWRYVLTRSFEIRAVKNQKVDEQMKRQELVARFETEVRRCRFIVCGYKFKFSWGANQFAKSNSLTLENHRLVFDDVRTEANEKLRIVLQRLRRKATQRHIEHDEAGNLVEVQTLIGGDVLSEFLQLDNDQV